MNNRVVVVPLILAMTMPGVAFAAVQAPDASNRGLAYFHFSRARLLDEQGQWNRAIDEYKKALEADPNNSLVYSEMAETYLRHRRVTDAAEAAEKAIQIDPSSLEAHKTLGTIYTSMIGTNGRGDDAPDKAIREFEAIVRLDPSDRQAHLMLGRLYTFRNRLDKATEIYRKLLGIEPGSEEATISLARLQIDAGNNDEAVQLLSRFVAENSESDKAWEALGQAYANLEQFDKARDAYRKASALDPENIELRKALAQALYFEDQIEEAGRLYTDLVREDPNDGVSLLRLGQIYRRQAKYAMAREALQKAVQAFPENLEVQFNMVMLDRDEGLFEDAYRKVGDILNRSRRENGRYSEAEKQNRRVFLAQSAAIASQLGRHEDAVRAFNEIRPLVTDDGRIDAQIADTYRNARNLDKAVSVAEEALRQHPSNRTLQMLRADLIAEKGRVDDGIRQLQALVKGNESDLDVLSAMANIYQRARKFDEAQTIVGSMIRQFPEDDHGYFVQGSVYERQRKVDEAEKSFRRALELDKENPATLNYLGYMLADRGRNLEEALGMIRRAVDADPTNGAYLDSLGWALFKLNRLDEAEEFLKRALLFSGSDPTIHEHLGDLYLKRQKTDDARAAFAKSLELGTDPEEIDRVKKKLDALKGRVARK